MQNPVWQELVKAKLWLSKRVGQTIFSTRTMVDEAFLDQGFVIDVDGKTKGNSITWPSQPEEIGELIVLRSHSFTTPLLPFNPSSIREPVHIFDPPSWHGTRYCRAF